MGLHDDQAKTEYVPGELRAFAKWFKKERKKLGLIQMDVSLALGISCGLISEFERCNLSWQRMSKLKPLLQKYIEGDAKLGKKFALEKSLERVMSNTSSGM